MSIKSFYPLLSIIYSAKTGMLESLRYADLVLNNGVYEGPGRVITLSLTDYIDLVFEKNKYFSIDTQFSHMIGYLTINSWCNSHFNILVHNEDGSFDRVNKTKKYVHAFKTSDGFLVYDDSDNLTKHEYDDFLNNTSKSSDKSVEFAETINGSSNLKVLTAPVVLPEIKTAVFWDAISDMQLSGLSDEHIVIKNKSITYLPEITRLVFVPSNVPTTIISSLTRDSSLIFGDYVHGIISIRDKSCKVISLPKAYVFYACIRTGFIKSRNVKVTHKPFDLIASKYTTLLHLENVLDHINIKNAVNTHVLSLVMAFEPDFYTRVPEINTDYLTAKFMGITNACLTAERFRISKLSRYELVDVESANILCAPDVLVDVSLSGCDTSTALNFYGDGADTVSITYSDSPTKSCFKTVLIINDLHCNFLDLTLLLQRYKSSETVQREDYNVIFINSHIAYLKISSARSYCSILANNSIIDHVDASNRTSYNLKTT